MERYNTPSFSDSAHRKGDIHQIPSYHIIYEEHIKNNVSWVSVVTWVVISSQKTLHEEHIGGCGPEWRGVDNNAECEVNSCVIIYGGMFGRGRGTACKQGQGESGMQKQEWWQGQGGV
jgi:hypothetical protein